MSQKILAFNIFFNLLMTLTSLYERKYVWALYWLGAIVLNSAVWLMKK